MKINSCELKFSIQARQAPEIGHSKALANGRLDNYDVQPDELEDYDSDGIAIPLDAELVIDGENDERFEIQLSDDRVKKNSHI